VLNENLKILLKSPKYSQDFRRRIILKLSELIEKSHNYPEIIISFIKSLEGLNEYEAIISKSSLLLTKSKSATSLDTETFLDLQIETFFSIPLLDRTSYILEQLLTSIRFANFQKAKYIMRKIDYNLLNTEQRDLYFKSRLIVNLFFKDFKQSVETLKEFVFSPEISQLLHTFNVYLGNIPKNSFTIGEFDEKDFIDRTKLNEIYERYKPTIFFIPENIDIYRFLKNSASFHVMFV
jgi:hypothetical protein